jgi:hypothetical protein
MRYSPDAYPEMRPPPDAYALAFQQFAHQTFGRLCIAAALHDNPQDETVLINWTPLKTSAFWGIHDSIRSV